MTKALSTEKIKSKPSFADLMELYARNYRLLSALLEDLDGRHGCIQNKDGYTLKIIKKRSSCYTQYLELHYSFHTYRQNRKIVIAIASFKVCLYLDTAQAAVTVGKIKLKTPLQLPNFSLLFRTKWCHNHCLRVIMRSFFI